MDLSLISFSAKMFEVKLPSSVDPGKTAEGTLKLKKSALDKSFEKSFTFEINDEKNSRFTIPVKRTVRITANKGSGKAGK